MQISDDLLSFIAKLKEKDGQIRNASVSQLSKIIDKQTIEAVAIKLISTFGNIWESNKYSNDNKKDILKDFSRIINTYGPDAYNAIINNLDPTIKTGKYTEIGNWSSDASNVLGALGDVVIPFLIPSLEKSKFTHHSLGF